MEIITNIIIITFGILQIILFFKIWGMTNDIKQIKNKYLSSDQFERGAQALDQSGKFKIEDSANDLKKDSAPSTSRDAVDMNIESKYKKTSPEDMRAARERYMLNRGTNRSEPQL